MNWYLNNYTRLMFNYTHAVPVDPNFGPSFASASANCLSASAFTAVAFVIADAIFSALTRNTGGSFAPNTHNNTTAKIPKLTHLKS